MCEDFATEKSFKILVVVDENNPKKIKSNSKKFPDCFQYISHNVTATSGKIVFDIITKKQTNHVNIKIHFEQSKKIIKKKIQITNPEKQKFRLFIDFSESDITVSNSLNLQTASEKNSVIAEE
jgi:hypothetical protein